MEPIVLGRTVYRFGKVNCLYRFDWGEEDWGRKYTVITKRNLSRHSFKPIFNYFFFLFTLVSKALFEEKKSAAISYQKQTFLQQNRNDSLRTYFGRFSEHKIKLTIIIRFTYWWNLWQQKQSYVLRPEIKKYNELKNWESKNSLACVIFEI